MENPLISVIVPIYKVEQYLDKCITSIVNQTYKNLEIILVDDGSPDNCPSMCDQWKKKDSRIKVIHKENGGAGESRNIGLDIASGDFITFVDSDDYIFEYMYEMLINSFNLDEEIDIVECDYISVFDDNFCFNIDSLHRYIYNTKEALKENINDSIFKQLIWNKLYKKKTIKDIRFPVGKKIDDEYFTYRVLGNAKKLVHLDAVMYAYRMQETSVMHSLDINARFQGIVAKVERQEYLIKYYSELEDFGTFNLYNSCLYLGQLCLKDKTKNSNKILKYMMDIIKRYPIRNINDFTIKNRIWLFLINKSLVLTCEIRNLLKIGI